MSASTVKCPACGFVKWSAEEPCKKCASRHAPAVATQMATAAGRPKKPVSTAKLFLLVGVCAGAVCWVCMVIGLALGVGRGVRAAQASTPAQRFSSKAEQVEWLVNSVSEEECERNTEKINGPFHEITREERALGSVCYMKYVKAHQPLVWENALSELRKKPAD